MNYVLLCIMYLSVVQSYGKWRFEQRHLGYAQCSLLRGILYNDTRGELNPYIFKTNILSLIQLYVHNCFAELKAKHLKGFHPWVTEWKTHRLIEDLRS